MKLRKRKFLTLVFLAVLLGISAIAIAPSLAQDGITLQVAIPEFARNFLSEDAFAQFEADNPGVKVSIVYTGFDALFAAPAASDIVGHLDDIEEYISQADVVTVSSTNLTVEATRAGYFLDLSPLTSADTSLGVDDFFPAAWQAFQWDSGVWALPSLASVVVVMYNPATFDEAGITYPNESWAIDDFANAARALAEYDTAGNATSPGLVTFGNTAYLLRALLGQGFYDNSTIPETPSFDNPNLETLLTSWAEFESEGIFSQGFSGNITDAPLRIFSAQGGGGFGPGGEGQESVATLLPGGTAGIDAQGFAVSSGTQYPELAYALAKYLTYNTQIANSPFGNTPARQSLIGVQPDNNGGEGGTVFVGGSNSPEMQAVIDAGLENGLSVAEMRYSDYVDGALNNMVQNSVDAQTALQDAESSAVTNLQTAADRQTTTTVFVATPVPEVVLQPGEVALNFGLQSFVQPLPNSEQWEQLARDFAASDPQVGEVNIDTGGNFGGNADNFAADYDCYYLPYNAVPNLDTSTVLNLDPFLDVDPSFDRNDLVGNALSLVQKENRTWALPIVIFPEVLRYHTRLFDEAGIPAPENGWTIDQFVDALRVLKPTADDAIPFNSRGAGGNYLLQLIAAYGGLPLDRRTDPPTINFTDPTTIEAIRQVLDLAKDGYISYQELGRTSFNITVSGEQEDAIYTESLTGFGLRQILRVGDDISEDPYRITTYPTGDYSTISYDMGTAYISATTQNADACYRWINTIAQHPELFSSMPARRSIINSAAFVAAQGADTVAIYNQIDGLMSDANTVNFQSPFAGGTDPSDFLLEFWLNRAFDHYVLEDAELETELAEAQTFSTAYLECVANIPPFDEAVQDRQTFVQQFIGCATSVDPEMGNLLFAQPAESG